MAAGASGQGRLGVVLIPHKATRAAISTMEVKLGVFAHELRGSDSSVCGAGSSFFVDVTITVMSTCLQVVDMDGAVAALRCDELVERIPGNALYVVIVLRNFANDVAILDIDDARDKVGATYSQRFAVGTPCHVVEFLLGGTTHQFDSPKLFLKLTFAFEGRGITEARFAAVTGDPEENVAVIACSCEQLALGAESNDVDHA